MRSHIGKLLVAILVFGSCAFSATAQTKPNLSGKWKLNSGKSKFGSEAAPQSVVELFEQQGATLRESLTVVNSKGTSTVNYNYSLDGKEVVNLVDGEKVTAVAKWDGNTLVLEWKDEGGTFRRQLTLSDSGNTLTVAAHDASADGEANDILVLERQ